MEEPPKNHPLSEQLLFLLDQLTLTSELYLEATAPIMEALKTARAPQSLGLEAQLQEPQEYAQILQEILADLEQQLKGSIGELGEFASGDAQSLLDQEIRFWQEFVGTITSFTQKLLLLAPQEKSSALILKPLQDTWQELLKLAE